MEKEKRPMNYDELIGGFAFATETIDVNVPENTTGVYLLSKGERSSRGNLYVDYVGRAVATETEDLRKRLKNHLNNPDEQQSDESGRLVSMDFRIVMRFLIEFLVMMSVQWSHSESSLFLRQLQSIFGLSCQS